MFILVYQLVIYTVLCLHISSLYWWCIIFILVFQRIIYTVVCLHNGPTSCEVCAHDALFLHIIFTLVPLHIIVKVLSLEIGGGRERERGAVCAYNAQSLQMILTMMSPHIICVCVCVCVHLPNAVPAYSRHSAVSRDGEWEREREGCAVCARDVLFLRIIFTVLPLDIINPMLSQHIIVTEVSLETGRGGGSRTMSNVCT